MNTLRLITLATLVATPAFAANHKNYQSLKEDAQQMVQLFNGQEDTCDVRVKELRDGFTLSVKTPGQPVVYFDVANDSQIRKTGEQSPDDSYGRTYLVKGEGKVEFVHVDDSYDHFYVTKDGKTTSCELDY